MGNSAAREENWPCSKVSLMSLIRTEENYLARNYLVENVEGKETEGVDAEDHAKWRKHVSFYHC